MVTVDKPLTAEALGLSHPLIFDELVIEFPDSIPLTDELICDLSALNDTLIFERDEAGRLLVMTGPDYDSDHIGRRIMSQIFIWDADWVGEPLAPSSTSHLPDDNLRQPDAGWLSPETAANARSGERPHPHIAPDFVVEVRSSTQSIPQQQRKLQMWMRNGVRLGWLVDPQSRTVWEYRPDSEPVQHEDPAELSADPPCDGLTISFDQVW